MRLMPACSETTFKLTGSLSKIKSEVKKMLDTIIRQYKTEGGIDKEWIDKRAKEVAGLKKRIDKIKTLAEFRSIVIPFTTNYETYFNPKNDGSLDVATCNNIDWDSIDSVPAESDGYSETAGKHYFKAVARGDEWVVLDDEDSKDDGGKLFRVYLERANGKPIGKLAVGGIGFVEMLDMNDGTFVCVDDTKQVFRKITDEKKLAKIYPRVLAEEI